MSSAHLKQGYEIAGYRIDSFIGAGSKGHVYLASKNDQHFALKIIDHIESAEALNFHRESAIAARFKHPVIAKVFDFGQDGSIHYIAMEFADGITLQERLRQGAMDLGEVVRVGIALTSALQEVHNSGYIHRDVKPENVVLCFNGEIKLIDFGLAGSISDLSLSPVQMDAIGTFDYASPEQSGVLQRPVDGRSDLYAVGVVLYQCLTGELPFTSSNLRELLDMHAHQKPRAIRELNPLASPAFEKILEKLLEKDPDSRYQSAAGLLFDLQALSKLDQVLLETKVLNLGSQDLSNAGAIRLPLLGRQTEMSLLKAQFRKAMAGAGNCVIIEGEGGLGKSRLARELVSNALETGVPVLAGKCSSQEKDVPYALFKQALDHYLYQIRQMPRDLALVHEQKIRDAGQNSKATLLRLNSGLRSILGPDSMQEGILDLEAFAMGVRNFFCDLTDLHQGLVLHLDDIQWIDSGSLAILKSISQVLQSKKLFIQATARNDQQSLSALQAFVQALEPKSFQRLSLKPLDLKMTGEIAKSFLGGHEVAPEISEKLFAFSNGNPFVLTENVSRLISSGCLRMIDGKWQLNELEFSKVGLSENVYDLVLERVGKLGPQIRETLQFAAIIGHSFDFTTLKNVLALNERDLKDRVQAAVRAHVIELVEPMQFRFVHDRIREALLSTVDAEAIKDINEQLVEVLERSPIQSESQAYELARYISLGHPDRNPSRAFSAFIKAGQFAKSANASQQAYEYFTQAAGFETRAQAERPLRLQFLMDYAAVCTELGRIESAHGLLNQALKAADSSLEKAQIMNLRSQALAHVAPYRECWDSDVELLRQLKQELPEKAVPGFFSAVKYLALHLWITLPFFNRAKTDSFRDHCLLSANIYERMTITGYFTGRKVIMLPIGIRFLYYARLMGPSIYLVRAHGYLGQVASILGLGPWMNFHLRKSAQVAEQLNSKVATLLSSITEAIARERFGDDQIAEAMYVKSMPDIEKYLSTMNFGLAWGGLGLYYYMRGHNQRSLALVQRNLPRTDRVGRLGGMVTLRFMLYHQYLILGRMQEADEVLAFITENLPKLGSQRSYAWANLRASEFSRQYELDEISEEVDSQIEAFESFQFDSLHFFLSFAYIGYIRQYQYEHAKTEEQKLKALAQLDQQLRFMKKCMKVPVGLCHFFILQSASLRFRKKYADAEMSLVEAEKLALKSDSIFATFMLLKEKSRLAGDQNKFSEAQICSRMAYEMAIKHEWRLRAEQVAKEFGLDTSSLQPAKVSSSESQPVSAENHEDRIANSLLRISLVASFEMNSQKQIQISLDEIVKVMGAERSYVFLWDSNENGLKYSGGRDHQGKDLEEPKGYSSTVVNKVAETQKSLIVMGDDQMEALGSRSAVIHGLRSIIASPLVLKGELKGVVYVDSSVSKVLFTEKDTELLAAIASHIAIAFENLRMMNIESAKREMQKDLELSAAIQSMLFPKSQAVSRSAVQLFGYNRPAIQCGGDWWWHETSNDNCMQIFVGDVTGHGAGPAMITSFLAACFKMGRRMAGQLAMPELFKTISQLIYDLTDENYLVSAISIQMEFQSRKMTCWNCGTGGLYVLRKDGPIENIGGLGSLLGQREFDIEAIEVLLQPGDRVFIPTDGLYEQSLAGGRSFGLRRVLKTLEKTRHLPVAECVKLLIEDFDEARDQASQDDDITIIYCEVC